MTHVYLIIDQQSDSQENLVLMADYQLSGDVYRMLKESISEQTLDMSGD